MRRLVLVTAVVISFIVIASPTSAEVKGCAPTIGKRVPIVLVHGLNSSKEAWGEKYYNNSMLNALSRNSDFFVETFDYSEASKEWVDDPRIGPALASKIACLAESSRQGGGVGKVVAVGHSMGGLAIRFASRTVSQDIGLVVTIGTPNTGSGWANIGAVVRLACLARKMPSCDLFSGGAMSALQNNKGKTESLPTLKVPVFAVAGDETLHGYLFKKKLTQTTNSDIIVSKKSALLPDSAETFTMPCDGPMINPFVTTCWHSALTNNPTVEKRILDTIRKYLVAQLPSACQQEDGKCAGERIGDVDGDGMTDKAGLAYLPWGDDSTTSAKLRVVFFSGESREYVTRVGGYTGLVGLSDIDADNKDEIFILTQVGTHTQHIEIVEWEEGVLRSPQGDLKTRLYNQQDPLSTKVTVYVDGYYAGEEGFRCFGHGRFKVWSLARNSNLTAYEGYEITYQADEKHQLRKTMTKDLSFSADREQPAPREYMEGAYCSGLEYEPSKIAFNISK